MPERAPAAAGQGLRARIVDPCALPEEEVGRWREFGQAGGAFLDVDYARAVAESREGVRVAVLEQGGEVCGFFPFQFKDRLHRFLGAAEPVGAHMTDSVGVIAMPALHLTPERLLRAAGLRHFQFSHLDAAQAAHGLQGERVEDGLAIDLDQGSEAYLAALAANESAFVADTERRRRRLCESHGPLSFTFYSGDGDGELDRLIAAKREQYRRTGVRDVLAPAWTRRLLHRLAGAVAPECAAVLSTLHAGETWVASHLGLRSGERLHYWFPVYNPALAAHAPGRLLLMEIVGAASAEGIAVIERGTGTQADKQVFANLTRRYGRGAWQLQGARAFLARGLAGMDWRIEAWRHRQAAE